MYRMVTSRYVSDLSYTYMKTHVLICDKLLAMYEIAQGVKPAPETYCSAILDMTYLWFSRYVLLRHPRHDLPLVQQVRPAPPSST